MADTHHTLHARRPVSRRPRRATRIASIGLGAALVLTITTVLLAPAGASRPTTPSGPPPRPAANAPRPSHLDAADWAIVKNVVRMRTMALAPGRTATYRSFAAYMGLTALLHLHPVRHGRCAVAISYLYDNLLDLRDSYPGENWRPLRRLIRTQPPLTVCAPTVTRGITHVA